MKTKENNNHSKIISNMTDLNKISIERKVAVIAGDVTEFAKELEKFEEQNEIVEKHISSQLVQMPNPSYIEGVTSATQPPFVMGAMVSAVLFYYEKKS